VEGLGESIFHFLLGEHSEAKRAKKSFASKSKYEVFETYTAIYNQLRWRQNLKISIFDAKIRFAILSSLRSLCSAILSEI
jgi:hypothetical protein